MLYAIAMGQIITCRVQLNDNIGICTPAAFEQREKRFPFLTVVDPNRKVPDLYFKVVYPKLQADLKSEVGELIPPI